MEKLNVQKESVIEVLRLIDKKMAEVLAYSILHPKCTIIANFSVTFYSHDDEAKGDVYYEQMGKLKD